MSCGVIGAMCDGAEDPGADAGSTGAKAEGGVEYTPPPAKLDDPEENARLLDQWRAHIQAAREAFKRLDVQSAERELQLALEDAAHFGAGSAPMATSLLNLAQLYRRAGRLEEARPLLERASDTLDQTAGPNNKVTLLALVDLANTQRDLGEVDDAAETFADVLRRLDAAEETQVHGRAELRAVRASVLMQAARMDARRGEHGAAEARLREALALAEARWGADSPRLLAPYTELATLMSELNRFVEARELCARAEQIAEQPAHKKHVLQLRERIEAAGSSKAE